MNLSFFEREYFRPLGQRYKKTPNPQVIRRFFCCWVGNSSLRIGLNVFLHIDELALAVVEFVLEEC